MKEWYLNTPTPNICSGYESDEIDEYGVSNFSDVMYTNFSDSVIKCNHDRTIESTLSAIIQGVVEDNVTSTTKRQLLCSIGSFGCGDYVYFENSYWIVVVKPSNNKVYEKAIAECCNWTLKFQNSTGTILSYPCITKSTRLDEETGKVITLGANQKSILCRMDSETLKIKNDETKTWRFYVDKKYNPTPYKLIGDTETTEHNYGDNGLIEMLVEQDVSQTTDRLDLGVCNYVETTTPTPPSGIGYADILVNGDLIIGTTRTFTAKFYNADGTENTSIIANWNVEYNPSANNVYFVESTDGNICTIAVQDEAYDAIDTVVTITVDDGLDGYVGSKIMTVTA